MPTLPYQRVVIKLSGEVFKGVGGVIDHRRLLLVVKELRTLKKMGAEIAVVVGAGNLWRKRSHGQGIAEETADYIGLLATVMNGLALKDALKKNKLAVILQSPIANNLPGVTALDVVAARGSMRRGEIVVFAGGTGKPFFTTDTAAALRARDIRAQLIIKTGPADGVYSADPKRHKLARKIKQLSLSQAIKMKLGIMDQSAFKICQQNHIAIVVCRWQAGALTRVLKGNSGGSLIIP